MYTVSPCAPDIMGDVVPARFLNYLRENSNTGFQKHLKTHNKAARTSLYQMCTETTNFKHDQDYICSARLYLQNTLRAGDNIPLDVAVHDQSSAERAMEEVCLLAFAVMLLRGPNVVLLDSNGWNCRTDDIRQEAQDALVDLVVQGDHESPKFPPGLEPVQTDDTAYTAGAYEDSWHQLPQQLCWYGPGVFWPWPSWPFPWNVGNEKLWTFEQTSSPELSGSLASLKHTTHSKQGAARCISELPAECYVAGFSNSEFPKVSPKQCCKLLKEKSPLEQLGLTTQFYKCRKFKYPEMLEMLTFRFNHVTSCVTKTVDTSRALNSLISAKDAIFTNLEQSYLASGHSLQ